jgi:integral membrane sensor domain MASE1
LIVAGLVRAVTRTTPRFDRSRDVWIFIAAAGLGTFLSSFLDVGFVTLSGVAASSFWDLWRTRFLSNVLAAIILVSAIVTWAKTDLSKFLAAPNKRQIEAFVLGVGLLAVSAYVFQGEKAGLTTAPVSLYACCFLSGPPSGLARAGTSAAPRRHLPLDLGRCSGRGPFSPCHRPRTSSPFRPF